ncbi:hypothetical protein [Streptococcus moroccensis]|uniref:30S ribosomal protein S10 n=1 Tax=Streptococcus moroccensis TaxID=1451356 RepID=A0ABT9YPY3_9STRE|nr:hypothetical protein [Streptococcus moroccensis]MDQ0222059.1 hypothetical protein [Streptococcus moroccensis]
MGKYQLDYKGMKQVERFHEKHSKGVKGEASKAQDLKAQFAQKLAKKK